MPEPTVTIYDADSGTNREFLASVVREVARKSLGMVDGPFELTIFTRTVLARAMQREQVDRLEALRESMATKSPDYRAKLTAVTEIESLLVQLGIEEADWVPGQPPKAASPVEIAKPVTEGNQIGLLDDQASLF